MGYERLDQEMELTRIIKTIRDIKIVLEHFAQYPEINRKI